MKNGEGGAPDTRKHVKFAKSMADYAGMYETTDRAIKRWVRVGKLKGDNPPLDEPCAMAAWWARCMERGLPTKLLALAQPPAKPSAPPKVQARDSPPAPPRDFSGVAGMSLEQNVEELRHTLAVNKVMMDEALTGTDEREIALRQRNYKEVFELLRKAEDTLVKVQRERGNLIERGPVEAEIAQFFETLRLQRQTMPAKILNELEALLPRRVRRVMRILGPHLVIAVERVREAEEKVFQNLDAIEHGGSAATASLLAA